ncbi:uncharacterized protein LOC135845654 [Planococcus citri]|uniref:uncharacterized protein LOC135845654 n=1 Tax=Planococcus citri TaxID=170843 RepID=UPI0031F7DB09
MSVKDKDNVIMKSDESCVAVNVNAANVGHQRRISSQELRDSLEYDIIEEYIWLGKPTSYINSQVRASSVYLRAIRLILGSLWGPRSTVPWDWEEHALVAASFIKDAGFDSNHLLVVEFVNEENPDVKKTMTLYSSENCDVFEKIPTEFVDFCSKLMEICNKTTSSQPQPGKPTPMVALFNYSQSNHQILNLIEEGFDVKSALTSLLRELGVIKSEKLCKVQAFDPYRKFPDVEFEQRHIKYRESVTDHKYKSPAEKGWIVTPIECENFLDQIEKTKALNEDFRKIVMEFASNYLPKTKTETQAQPFVPTSYPFITEQIAHVFKLKDTLLK